MSRITITKRGVFHITTQAFASVENWAGRVNRPVFLSSCLRDTRLHSSRACELKCLTWHGGDATIATPVVTIPQMVH